MNLFINYLASDPFFFFSWVVVVIFSICIHEYAHAYTALRLGDDTAARAGHLSLNPLVQMGPTSLIFLALIGIAWGSVPVAIRRFRAPWAGAVVAFAGPAANVLLCVLFALLGVVSRRLFGETLADEVYLFFRLGATANGVLFVLNMLPIPMLDGWSVFSYILPGMNRISPSQAQHVSLLLIAVLFLTPASRFIWLAGGGLAHFFMGMFSFVLGA